MSSQWHFTLHSFAQLCSRLASPFGVAIKHMHLQYESHGLHSQIELGKLKGKRQKRKKKTSMICPDVNIYNKRLK